MIVFASPSSHGYLVTKGNTKVFRLIQIKIIIFGLFRVINSGSKRENARSKIR